MGGYLFCFIFVACWFCFLFFSYPISSPPLFLSIDHLTSRRIIYTRQRMSHHSEILTFKVVRQWNEILWVFPLVIRWVCSLVYVDIEEPKERLWRTLQIGLHNLYFQPPALFCLCIEAVSVLTYPVTHIACGSHMTQLWPIRHKQKFRERPTLGKHFLN